MRKEAGVHFATARTATARSSDSQMTGMILPTDAPEVDDIQRDVFIPLPFIMTSTGVPRTAMSSRKARRCCRAKSQQNPGDSIRSRS